MGQAYVGEIRMWAGSFAPAGWLFCNGQFLPINQNQALFSLLGTTYGGDGRTTFALPDLRGRVPIHVGNGFVQGERGGEEAHTLTQSEMPAHNHFLMANNAGATQAAPGGAVLASSANTYAPLANLTTIAPGTLTTVGGSQPHSNLQPYLVINWMIALQGIFPSQN